VGREIIHSLAGQGRSIFCDQDNANALIVQCCIERLVDHFARCDNLSFYTNQRKSPDGILVPNDHKFHRTCTIAPARFCFSG
jgi:hypothetical protein